MTRQYHIRDTVGQWYIYTEHAIIGPFDNRTIAERTARSMTR